MSERKVALVIDGMTTLGTAICQRLRRDGFTVAASFPAQQRNPDAWLAAQRDEGGSFSAWRTDVTAFDECGALVEKLLEAHGRLDVLVNLLARTDASADAGLAQLSQPDWHAAVRRTLDGAFNINKHALPPMLERQWGRIIQVAAGPVAPLPGRRLAAGHAAANAALHGLTRALALETARHGVTVNTIMPGYLRRDVPEDDDQAARDAAGAAQIPVGRLGEADDVAGLVGYLASGSAGFVTGAQIAINGGQHMF